MGLIRTNRELYSALESYKVRKGYYYYDFSHTYKGLTSKQTDRFEKFVIHQISRRTYNPEDFIHFEDGAHTSLINGVREVKYAKIGNRYIGKVIIEYLMINADTYNTNFTYLTRTAIPRSTYKDRDNFRDTHFGVVNGGRRWRKSRYRSGNEYVSRTRKDRKVE